MLPRTLALVFLGLALVPTVYAQTRTAADVALPASPDLLARLQAAGVVLDHAVWEAGPRGRTLRTVLAGEELDAVRAAGVAVEVLDPDLGARYTRDMARGGCPTTPFPITGTHGCYPTFDQTLAILDQMQAQYPSLVRARYSIGSTHEGRGLWVIELGDNPGVDEGEPEVLLTALHHAREPQGMASLLHFVWTALAGYGTDPGWTRLLDSRRVFVLPVLNPDGYVYNQTTNPGGGGMWRKNRRANSDGSFGVDLNRNYGWQWGFDDSGSSPNPSSGTYRGPSAFSEPETVAVRDFVAARDFRIALNTHTFSNLLIYPWGYIPNLYTPDSSAFVDAARAMTATNDYLAGTANQTVGYLVNGSSDDWMYGNDGVLALTPEIGSSDDGFWPSPDRLLPLAEENVDMYRQAVRLAGGAPGARLAFSDDGPSGNGHPDPGERIQLWIELQNLGRADLAVTAVHLVPPAGVTAFPPASQDAFVLAPADVTTVMREIELPSGVALGELAGFEVEVVSTSGTERLPLEALLVGTPVALFTSDASSLSGWTATGGWGLTSSPVVSPPSAFTDSPVGPYASSADARLTLQQLIDVETAVAPALTFSARWEIESRWDFATVEASGDGITWVPLAGRYTTGASGVGAQLPEGAPGYEGTQAAWVQDHLSLASFAGQNDLRIRFRLRSDSFDNRDGIVVDDIAVTRLINGGTVSGGATPDALRAGLDVPSPNPSAGVVRLTARSTSAGPATLEVLDTLGRRVAVLFDGDVAAGVLPLAWDGRDTSGGQVAPGVYVLRWQSADGVFVRPVVRLR